MEFSLFGYTKRQFLIFVILGLGNFASALCISLQAPFYPSEAEKKGATATQYGFVFGVFELIVFLISPIWGKFMAKIGPNFLCTTGLFFNGGTCIIFGQLDKLNGAANFIGFSFAVRITEALGNSGFVTSTFSIIAKEYPENTGSVFSTVEAFYGLGLIAGPTLGGFLYSARGYSFPFTVLGTFLLFITLLAYFFLPMDKPGEGAFVHGTTRKALRIKSIALMVFAIASTSYSIGCVQVGLEPHLRQFGLSPVLVGVVFVINGMMYAIMSPLWGILSDKYLPPRVVILIGGVSMLICFTLIGPAPYFTMEAPLWLIIFSLIFHGIGFGAELVGAYVCAQKEAILHGMPDDINTYGVISGLWMSSFAFGAFIGPTLTGYLLDLIGFRAATQVVVALHVCVIVFVGGYEIYDRRTRGKDITTVAMVNDKKMFYGSTDTHCGSYDEYVA